MNRILPALLGLAVCAAASGPVAEVRHDQTLCLTYTAALAGDTLVVRARIEPGWHTFAMDNQVRASEKLAGRKALSSDRETSIDVSGGLAVDGGWKQSQPADFSKPELRWFSFGFEKEATFAAKVKRTGGGAARLAIKGQACTDSICKNIDVDLEVPPTKGAVAIPTGPLVDVRTGSR